jgi:hypothetical protein
MRGCAVLGVRPVCRLLSARNVIGRRSVVSEDDDDLADSGVIVTPYDKETH